MMLEHIFVLSAYFFSIGIYGLITSRNMVRALMCLEQLLNSVNINFVTFEKIFDNGDIFSIFVIAIAAAEAAIGLAIVSSIYWNIKETRINQSNLLNKINSQNSNLNISK